MADPLTQAALGSKAQNAKNKLLGGAPLLAVDNFIWLNENAAKIKQVCLEGLKVTPPLLPPENLDNCSGFVRYVASKFNITLTGQADSIVNQIQEEGWTRLSNGVEAKMKADQGWLVIGGLKAKDTKGKDPNKIYNHGHVVIVVAGKLTREKYPLACWGSLGGRPSLPEGESVSKIWYKTCLDDVIYSAKEIS